MSLFQSRSQPHCDLLNVGEVVTFDASGSYDLDGSILSYDWAFGDGTTGVGRIATHAYSSKGFLL